MKVILQHDIPKVGKHGEIVNVADGYARNYLFPRNLAVVASGGHLKTHQAQLAREKEKDAKLLGSAQASADKIKDAVITLVGKVGSGTKLYGSITAGDVADAIKANYGVEVDKRRVGLADPIKVLGVYPIPVRMHSDISVTVTVEVMTQEQIDWRIANPAPVAAPVAVESEEVVADAE